MPGDESPFQKGIYKAIKCLGRRRADSQSNCSVQLQCYRNDGRAALLSKSSFVLL